MDERFSVIILISLVVFIPSARCLCDFKPVYSINETAPNGTIILTVSKTAGSNVSVRVTDVIQPPNVKFEQKLQSQLLIRNYNTSFTLENTEPLDLERFDLEFQRDISNVNLRFTCDGIQISTILGVLPVNEFDPVFTNSPYIITIPESTVVNTTVFKLKPKVIDYDVGEVQIFFFSINPYNIQSADGKAYFKIYASSQGNISLVKALDYDSPDTRKTFRLNVSVADGDFRISYTNVTIFVQDVDDQVPYFKHPKCTNSCIAPTFEATTTLQYTGALKTMPIAIQGMDDDTLGTPLVYSIQAGNQYNMFEIDQTTAVVTQKTSVNALNLPDADFRLTIQVRKNLSSVELSSIAILTVHVRERMPNVSSYSVPPTCKCENASVSMIPVLVISGIEAIAIIALMVCVVMLRKPKTHPNDTQYTDIQY